MLRSILIRDLFTKFVWIEDEMVWNLMECRKFLKSTLIVGLPEHLLELCFDGVQRDMSFNVSLRKTAALGKNF